MQNLSEHTKPNNVAEDRDSSSSVQSMDQSIHSVVIFRL